MPEVFNSLDTGLVRGLQPGGKLDVRNLPKVFTRDQETEPPPHFTEYALARMLRTIDRIGVWLADQTRYVEEYSTSSEETAPNETTVFVVADYEPASEMITEILVTGPVTTAFTLTLGDRLMSLSTDATGKCLLSPVSMKLGPSAKRQVVGASAGNWFLHLSGHAMTSRRTA